MSFKTLHTYQFVFLRLCCLTLLIGVTLYVYLKGYTFTSILGCLIIVLLLIELYGYLQKVTNFHDKTITAILNNDFSSDLSNSAGMSNYPNLIKLYNRLKGKQNELESRDLVYRSILNNIETGILILEAADAQQTEWNIFLMNDYMADYFGIPKVTKWKYLKKHLPSLCNAVEAFKFTELKTSVQVQLHNRETQSFILQTSSTKAYSKTYYIIMLDSIQRVVEKKEKEAWVNLMKVISHELMNSLTPIRSLSQNIQEVITQDSLSKEDLSDMKQSVQTIIKRSNHLQFFVDNYRQLAMLPTPDKEKVNLEDLVKSCIEIMMPLFKTEGIVVKNIINTKVWLDIDRLQMEQVFINLFTNSLYALKENNLTEKQIEVRTKTENNRIYISISDTGKGIDKEIENKIFLPFFTTRQDGAGIGLTLSKNIIEAHDGYLSFKQSQNKTTFVVCLIL